MTELEDREMSLTEHLEELRWRLIISLLALAAGTVIVWSWSGELLNLLAPPGGLIFTAPTEALFTRFKVSVFGGFLLCLPVILYEVWSFTACALERRARRGLGAIVPASYVLFLTGVSLAVFIVVPAAMRVLMGFGSETVRPFMAVGPYVGFVSTLALAFGAVFQIPLVLLVLNRAGVVRREALARRRRYIYVIGFAVAGILTPGPDVFSQLTMALPIIILFELSLLLMRRSEA